MPLKRPPAGTPALYAQDGKGFDAIVHAHYFVGGCDWWVTEYSATDDEGFGYACLGDPDNAELGYVSLAELEAVRAPITINGVRTRGILPVEYETGWTPRPLRDCLAEKGLRVPA